MILIILLLACENVFYPLLVVLMRVCLCVSAAIHTQPIIIIFTTLCHVLISNNTRSIIYLFFV